MFFSVERLHQLWQSCRDKCSKNRKPSASGSAAAPVNPISNTLNIKHQMEFIRTHIIGMEVNQKCTVNVCHTNCQQSLCHGYLGKV